MKVIVNGREQEISTASLVGYLEVAGFKTTQVVVEVNGKVIPRVKLPGVSLKEGDRLEIVIPVAGG